MIRQFTEDFRILFELFPHRPGDQIFLATIGDLELHGLAEYAVHAPTSRIASWHLQFHFNLFQGRPHEYDAQRERLHACRKWVAPAFNKLRAHQVHCYNTSQELAEQYRQLGLAQFESLAYPINPTLQSLHLPNRSTDLHTDSSETKPTQPKKPNIDRNASDTPLRVTLAGAVRPEKGQEQLRNLVQAIDKPLLETGKVQLVIQRKRRSRYRRQQVDLTDVLGESMSNSDIKPIEYVEHPLDEQAYESLLKRADVGLFLYDGRTYYARRAGVLGEFLSLGVPVVVPAACWLSEQFRAANEEYLSKLFDSQPTIGTRCGLTALTKRSDLFLKSDQTYPLRFEGNAQAQRLLIRFRSAVDQGGTGFIKFRLTPTTQNVSRSQSLNPGSRATAEKTRQSPHADLGIAPTGGVTHDLTCKSLEDHARDSYCILPMPAAREHTLEISAAYNDSRVQLDRIEFSIVDAAQPLGVVGLVAADASQVPHLLQELQQHFRHYQRSAVEFSEKWYQTHDSTQVVRQLINRSQDNKRRAA